MSQNNVGGSVDADSGEETNSNDSSEDCVELKSPFENEAQDVILLRKITIFLTEPNSSWWSFVYCTITSIVVLIHILFVCLESADGPNQYTNRPNNAAYDFLLNEQQYWTLEQVLLYPIVADSIIRLIVLCAFMSQRYRHVGASEILHNHFQVALCVCDIVGICPFVVKAVYLQPYNVFMPQFARLSYRVVDLFQIGKVLRSIKDVPSIWAIRLTLYKATPKLVLPIFFFVVCNVSTGVIFYFMEPCYDTSACAWNSLFSSSFFSVVTMSTVGYGNQIPYFEPTRLVACFVMIFGALFMSMPLAIIGNEYEDAWKYVALKVDELKAAERLVQAQYEWESYKRKMPLTAAQMSDSEHVDSVSSVSSDSDDEGQVEAVRPTSPVDIKSSNCYETSHNKPLVPTFASDEQKHVTRGRIRGDSLADESEVGCKKELVEMVEEELGESSEEEDHDSKLDNDISEYKEFCKVTPMYVQEAPLVQGVIDPFNNIKLLIRKIDRCFVKSDAITPTILLTACQLIGWFTPFLYALNGVSTDVYNRGKILQQECEECKTSLSKAYIAYENAGKVEVIRPKKNKRISILGGNLAEFEHQREQIAEMAQKNLERERIKYLGTDGENSKGKPRSQNRLMNRSSFSNQTAEELVDSIKAFALKHKSVVIYGKQMRWAQAHPNSFRARAWMALENPHGSKEARIIQFILIALICLSILLLFTETLASWTDYGEQSKVCEKVVSLYCDGKYDNTKDPGCFVQAFDANGVAYTTNNKLQFGTISDCTDADCYGVAPNYGSVFNSGALATNMSCIFADGDDPLHVSPFQSTDELIKYYGRPNGFTSRDMMHKQSNVCKRMECDPMHEQLFDGNRVWILYEAIINGVFLLELGVRMSVSYSFSDFFFDRMNILDILCVVPFTIDVLITVFSKGGLSSLDLAFTASTPDALIILLLRSFKIFFLFKMFRHFKESKVLVETFHRAWKQLLAILSLMLFIVTLFGIIMYELERGHVCYVGDDNCEVPDSIADSVNIGDAILLNKYDEVTTVPNVFYGIWFSIVTVMTVGYGEIVPVTNGGMFMSVWLMLFGGLYMAMPLTVSATTYYMVHDLYHEKKELRKEAEKKKQDIAAARLAAGASDEEDDEQITRDTIGSIMADKMALDLSEESNHRVGNEVGLSFAKVHSDSGAIDKILKAKKEEEESRLEHAKIEALSTLNKAKIENHNRILIKLVNMKFALEEIMTMIVEEEAQHRQSHVSFSPLARAKHSAYHELCSEMQKTIKLLAFFTASKDTPLVTTTIHGYTQEAMFEHVNKLCKLHKRCLSNIHQYLSCVIRDLVVSQCDMKLKCVSEFLSELQKPSSVNARTKKEYINDGEDEEESDVEYDQDGDLDRDFEYEDCENVAPRIDRSTFPGQYQRIINNTCGFVRVVEKDIICLCSVSIALNVMNKDTPSH